MSQGTTVVTPERLAQGLTYQQFIAQIKVNHDRFQEFYESAKLTNEDAEFFRTAVGQGACTVLVLGEDWCPDVFRGLPVVARIAEASNMDIRIFPRDENLDIMSEFLKDGQHQSIPTVVFYNAGHEYLGHWIERPNSANLERAKITETVKQEMAGADDQEIATEARRRTTDRYPFWQQETVKELRQLLADRLGI
jgi:hypothetical protein